MAPRRPERLSGLWISDVSIRQPVFVTTVMLALVTFGILAFRTAPVNLLPAINVPVYAVSIAYPGAGPESVADQVVVPVEDALNTLAGLEHITSNSSEGLGAIILEFAEGSDIDKIDQDVREKVNGVLPRLPRGWAGWPAGRHERAGEHSHRRVNTHGAGCPRQPAHDRGTAR